MNPREKILAISAFSVTGLLLLVFILTRVILGPTAEARKLASTVALDIEKLEAKVGMEGDYIATLHDLNKRSYGSDPSTASEMSRAHLMKLISRSGIAGEDVSMTPVTGKTIKGGREVGWIVRVKGSQEKLTSLLYVLNADTHLHKLDNVSWSPIPGSTDLSLQGRFVTLVLDPVDSAVTLVDRGSAGRLGSVTRRAVDSALAADRTLAVRETVVNLNSPERRWYALITDRDIFRPYIKRPPPPPPAPRPPTTVRNDNPPPTPTPPSAPSSIFQLVGLPTWNNEVEVVIKNTREAKSTIYKIGDNLIGGEIIMVDYRPLPMIKKPEFISTSRVIVRIGRDYWAVDIGQYLTDKYVVTSDRLPEELRTRALPAATPASKPPVTEIKPGTPAPASTPVTTPATTPAKTDAGPAPVKPGTTSDSTTTSTALQGNGPVSQEADHAP